MKRLGIAIVTIFLFLGACFGVAQPLRIMTEDIAPFSFLENGVPRGISVDLLGYMLAEMKRSETTADIRFLPWARAYSEAQARPGSLLFSVSRTPARENLFKWVGPIYTVQLGLLAKKSAGLSLRGIEDLRDRRVVTIRDSGAEQLLIAQGADPKKLQRVTGLSNILPMLLNNHADAVAFNIPTLQYNLKAMGQDLRQFEVVWVLDEVQFYYAFHPQTDEALIRRFQQALAAANVRKGGTSPLERIVKAYLQ